MKAKSATAKSELVFDNADMSPNMPVSLADFYGHTIAAQISDLQGKAAMLRIAEDYERLAKRAQTRAIGTNPNSN
jgi:hypothetical protein